MPICPELVAALGEWKDGCLQSRLDLVFCNEFGEPCDRIGVGSLRTQASIGAGQSRQRRYDTLTEAQLRKHVDSLRETDNAHLAYLGHADVSITMRVYKHFLAPKKQDTMSDLERLIQND